MRTHLHGAEFSVGLMYLDRPPTTFVWPGLRPDVGFVVLRILLSVFSAAVAVLPALWFGRFDPARGRNRALVPAQPVIPANQGGPASRSGGAFPVGAAGADTIGTVSGAPVLLAAEVPRMIFGPLPKVAPRPGAAPGRLVAGEIRILLRGASRWWWFGAGLIGLLSLVVPAHAAPGVLLVAWIWPVVLWSRLGTQRTEHNVDTLLNAYPGAGRQLPAEWIAGTVLTMLTGAAPLVRMAVAGDWPGTAAWWGGALFIPSLAVALGVLGRSPRLFQALYLPLWYCAVNGIAALDYLGAVRVDGRPAGPQPLTVAAAAGALLLTAMAVRGLRQARR